MNSHFQTIDMSGYVLPGEMESRFSYADIPAVSGIPFAIVHLKEEHDSKDSLRMDLNKRVFLGDEVDDKLRGVASEIARHISGVATSRQAALVRG